ncbi:pyridoxamine 5'-phosphate oxidase family protein [Helicobacter sp. MIT 99-5507]|uniref:pyridoxamine 5'-phosphate oxidase family protein n=1 Tax=Helicobacter sp. MIT 99-5507 TaxID=152489 RepID=UPI000E1EF33B|nr:pyridoxamine 5'-phosphate oxidase family protein [Helicobacter sp. MIT 99-5507]RDU58510.1 pyridoxamine 5'-phosphate oxidase [Helicobacter sp. MIT 99-5507]
MNIKNLVEFMDKNAPCFLATKGTCGNPRIRPFHSPLLFDNKIYFCSNYEKNLIKHIKAHNNIEISCCSDDGEFIRLRAKAKFSDNQIIKEAMFAKFELLKNIYSDAKNPAFCLILLDEISAIKQNLNGDREFFKI